MDRQKINLAPVVSTPFDLAKESTNKDELVKTASCGDSNASHVRTEPPCHKAPPARDSKLSTAGQGDGHVGLKGERAQRSTASSGKGEKKKRRPSNFLEKCSEKRRLGIKSRKETPDAQNKQQNAKYAPTYALPDLTHCRPKVDTGLRKVSNSILPGTVYRPDKWFPNIPQKEEARRKTASKATKSGTKNSAPTNEGGTKRTQKTTRSKAEGTNDVKLHDSKTAQSDNSKNIMSSGGGSEQEPNKEYNDKPQWASDMFAKNPLPKIVEAPDEDHSEQDTSSSETEVDADAKKEVSTGVEATANVDAEDDACPIALLLKSALSGASLQAMSRADDEGRCSSAPADDEEESVSPKSIKSLNIRIPLAIEDAASRHEDSADEVGGDGSSQALETAFLNSPETEDSDRHLRRPHSSSSTAISEITFTAPTVADHAKSLISDMNENEDKFSGEDADAKEITGETNSKKRTGSVTGGRQLFVGKEERFPDPLLEGSAAAEGSRGAISASTSGVRSENECALSRLKQYVVDTWPACATNKDDIVRERSSDVSTYATVDSRIRGVDSRDSLGADTNGASPSTREPSEQNSGEEEEAGGGRQLRGTDFFQSASEQSEDGSRSGKTCENFPWDDEVPVLSNEDQEEDGLSRELSLLWSLPESEGCKGHSHALVARSRQQGTEEWVKWTVKELCKPNSFDEAQNKKFFIIGPNASGASVRLRGAGSGGVAVDREAFAFYNQPSQTQRSMTKCLERLDDRELFGSGDSSLTPHVLFSRDANDSVSEKQNSDPLDTTTGGSDTGDQSSTSSSPQPSTATVTMNLGKRSSIAMVELSRGQSCHLDIRNLDDCVELALPACCHADRRHIVNVLRVSLRDADTLQLDVNQKIARRGARDSLASVESGIGMGNGSESAADEGDTMDFLPRTLEISRTLHRDSVATEVTEPDETERPCHQASDDEQSDQSDTGSSVSSSLERAIEAVEKQVVVMARKRSRPGDEAESEEEGSGWTEIEAEGSTRRRRSAAALAKALLTLISGEPPAKTNESAGDAAPCRAGEAPRRPGIAGCARAMGGAAAPRGGCGRCRRRQARGLRSYSRLLHFRAEPAARKMRKMLGMLVVAALVLTGLYVTTADFPLHPLLKKYLQR